MIEEHSFSLEDLSWAIQNGIDAETIKRYLDHFDAATLRFELTGVVKVSLEGPFVPILYFAAERNSPEIVRLLCKSGARPNNSEWLSPLNEPTIPLLSYTIMVAERDLSDTTGTVLALLSSGAKSDDVPRDMWENYVITPTKDFAKPTLENDPQRKWCTKEIREALSRTLNLMQRYFLWKADQQERPSKRKEQIAQRFGLSNILEVPFHIIGQRSAVQQVLDSIVGHYLRQSQCPLVLLLTGASGHGKTELAKRMGELLALDTCAIDCTEQRHETDLFGPKAPYQGWMDGSKLNNFLCTKSGQRAVVFMDEFEKMSEEVRKALLLPFDSGFYKDRRFGKQLDCSRTIWILTSNLGQETISKFWASHLQDQSEEQQKKAPFDQLDKALRQNAIREWGAPLTGRLTEIVPYFPFNKGEQAVATFKFMRELWNKARKDINTDENEFFGHLFVNFTDEGQIASHLAARYYDHETGARSLSQAVNHEIEKRLYYEFLKQNEEISNEMNDLALTKFDVRLETGFSDSEIVVKRSGVKAVKRSETENDL